MPRLDELTQDQLNDRWETIEALIEEMPDETAVLARCLDRIAEENDRRERAICPACNGCGEGRYEGSICTRCKGSGAAYAH